MNGRRVDPRNPNPLTNPSWQPQVERPQVQVPARPQYQYTAPSYTNTPQYSVPSTPVTCNVKVDISATFGRENENYNIKFPNITFSSVSDFQDAKAKIAKYGYLDSRYVSSPTCGPIAVAAISQFLNRNPDRVGVTKRGSEFELNLTF